jgi:hypothetical protein
VSFADEIQITPREFLAGVVAALSLCGSLAFGYGVKSQQVSELQVIVMRHDAAILDLTKELTQLRLVVAELNGTLSKGK